METTIHSSHWYLLKTVRCCYQTNNKPIAFFSIILSKPQRNYTNTEKEMLAIVECLKQSKGIIFGYEINLLSNHKNLDYITSLSESQRVMLLWLILKEFGTNIQHISGVDNMVADTLSRLPSATSDKYESCTRNAQCCANELFSIGRVENEKYCFPLNFLFVQIEQQK